MTSVDLIHEHWLQRELRGLLTAVQYFTRIPIPAWVGHSPAQLTRAARYFPLVGCFVGGIGALVLWGASRALSPSIAVISSCAVTILLTGAFHEDGLADTFDGLGGAFTRERALEIMKDSRIGTFGVLALILVLLLKVTTLASLPVSTAVAALIAGHGVSRLGAVVLMWTLPYTRDDDSTRSKPVVEQLVATDVVIASLVGLAPLLLLGKHGVLGLLAVAGALSVLRLWFARRLHGYTGDTLGATQQLCEVAFYLALSAAWNSF